MCTKLFNTGKYMASKKKKKVRQNTRISPWNILEIRLPPNTQNACQRLACVYHKEPERCIS